MGKSKLGKLLFLMCTVDVIDYKYNIYLLLTWKHAYGYMNLPNLLLPNLPML